MRRSWIQCLALSAVLAVALAAQDEDGPGRGVARLSVLNGDVSVRRGDSGDWVAGAVNAPLVVQDRVLTGAASRAEIQFDWANMLRLASHTEVRLAELEYRRYQVELARGTVMLRVLRDIDAEIEVNTPSVSVRPTRKGSYRISVNEDGESEITARSGEAEIYTPTGVERLRPGRTMLVRGAPSNPEFRTVAAVARDNFDRWSEQRDAYLERTRAYRYVSRDIYGADELDYYGRWVWAPPYGWVWTPWGVAAWWAPYRHGRWVWVDWYGWTWLSYDPWGWAPFHYGRWFWHAPHGWCWWPGPLDHRHYWRPALVAFFGFHIGGVHVGFGFGRIGWVPLAPYEPYYAWYGPRYYRGYRGPAYVDNSIRIVNNVEIVNIYRNARVVNAVSGIDGEGFARGGRIQSIRVGEGEFRRASLVQGPPPVVPAAESVRFSDRPVRGVTHLPRHEPERFFARRPPAPIERVAFEEQRRGMEQIVRRAFSPAEGGERAIRGAMTPSAGEQRPPANLPRVDSGAPARGGEVRVWRAETDSGRLNRNAEERGWRRANEAAPVETGAGGATGGWRRIGEPAGVQPGNLPRTEIEREAGGWRRVGQTAPAEQPREPLGNLPRSDVRRSDPGRSLGAAPEQPAPAADEQGRGWRRFGEPVNRDRSPLLRTAPDRTGSVRIEGGEAPESGQGNLRRSSEPGWRRFGATAAPGDRGEPRSTPPETPSWRMSEPRAQPRQGMEPPRRTEPIFINPPIVRERVAPRYEGGGRVGAEPPRGSIRGGEVRGEPRGGEVRGGGAVRSSGEARGAGRVRGPR